MSLRRLPRNVWATSLASFFMDVSSEMVLTVLPLFLANVLGAKAAVIGLIEGVAEATASLLKLASGWCADRWRTRKWLAVAGYALSALSRPFFYTASSWGLVASVRWADRVGKGIRTAPRDALIADSVPAQRRGLAFGFQRAADTAGATLGVGIALGIVWYAQAHAAALDAPTFRLLVLASLAPAAVAVFALAWIARDVPITGILGMLLAFNLVYALVSTPAGRLSDRIGRRHVLIGGWLLYAVIYLGFGLVETGWQIWALYLGYGIYYGLAYGTSKAMIADLVPEELRGTAYGTYSAVVGLLDIPASVIAGVLWQGLGPWEGFGASAPFLFGGAMALLAALLMAFWMPRVMRTM